MIRLKVIWRNDHDGVVDWMWLAAMQEGGGEAWLASIRSVRMSQRRPYCHIWTGGKQFADDGRVLQISVITETS